mgnify:CR=1 FL=1
MALFAHLIRQRGEPPVATIKGLPAEFTGAEAIALQHHLQQQLQIGASDHLPPGLAQRQGGGDPKRGSPQQVGQKDHPIPSFHLSQGGFALILQQGRGAGFQTTALDVSAGNPHAQRLYERPLFRRRRHADHCGAQAFADLHRSEQLWLDPLRAEQPDEADFAREWLQMDWPAAVGQRFANWLNAQLRGKLPLGDAEARAWEKELLTDEDGFQQQLRALRQRLNDTATEATP